MLKKIYITCFKFPRGKTVQTLLNKITSSSEQDRPIPHIISNKECARFNNSHILKWLSFHDFMTNHGKTNVKEQMLFSHDNNTLYYKINIMCKETLQIIVILLVFLYIISCFKYSLSNFKKRFTRNGTCVALDVVAPSPCVFILTIGWPNVICFLYLVKITRIVS